MMKTSNDTDSLVNRKVNHNKNDINSLVIDFTASNEKFLRLDEMVGEFLSRMPRLSYKR